MSNPSDFANATTLHIVFFKQYDKWRSTIPFLHESAAMAHIEDKLISKYTIINGEKVYLTDKSYITEIRLASVQIDSMKKIDNTEHDHSAKN